MKNINRTHISAICGNISVAGKVRGRIDNKINYELEMIINEQCYWSVLFLMRARVLEKCEPNKEWLW